MLQVKIKPLNQDAVIPTYANNTDAGLDLTATNFKRDDNLITYNTGLSFEIPEGYVGLIYPRSSVYKTGLVLTNSVGVIDSGYRGEVLVKFWVIDDSCEHYTSGDRVAQMIITPYPKIAFTVVDSLSFSDRGNGGFGSTGR